MSVRRTVWTSEGNIYVQNPVASDYSSIDGIYRLKTFTANDATPAVSGGVVFRTANSSGTTITDFDGTEGNGHHIYVIIDDTYTTIAHSSDINMPGDRTLGMQEGEVIEFFSLDGVWIGKVGLKGY